MKGSITIFTDGAAKGNPGRGGYAAVIADRDQVIELGGFKERTTNNEMELHAVVAALTHVSNTTDTVSIYTDSKYVVEGATSWIYSWVKNDWQTKAKTPVANLELWQALLPLLKKIEIDWHKVPGHVGIAGNERADTIASTMAEKGVYQLYSGSRAAYSVDLSDTSFDESKKQERSDARKHSSQKAYSYVSLVKGVIETHSTWADCERRVKGQSATRFKKSLNPSDEQAIIENFRGKT